MLRRAEVRPAPRRRPGGDPAGPGEFADDTDQPDEIDHVDDADVPEAAAESVESEEAALLADPEGSDVPEDLEDEPDGPRWGLGDALGGWAIAQIASILALFAVVGYLGYPRVAEVGSAVGQAMGQQALGESIQVLDVLGELTIEWQLVLQVPLWLALVGAVVYASRRKGTSLREDFGLAIVPRDVPWGLGIGVACQLLLVPLVYLPISLIMDDQDVSEPARELVDTAVGPLGVLMLLVIVGLGAPIAEELFYRGLAQRALLRRLGRPVWAVGIASLFFAFAHLQTLQFPALIAVGVVFGTLALRTGRLGMSIMAHVGFNLTTAVLFLTDTGLPFS